MITERLLIGLASIALSIPVFALALRWRRGKTPAARWWVRGQDQFDPQWTALVRAPAIGCALVLAAPLFWFGDNGWRGGVLAIIMFLPIGFAILAPLVMGDPPRFVYPEWAKHTRRSRRSRKRR